MRKFYKFVSFAFLASALMLAPGCKDKNDDPLDPDNDATDVPGLEQKDGYYGDLNGNLITIGGTRNVEYTRGVVLGTVDFNKISKDHTYGIVYMEAVDPEDFDYDARLLVEGHNGKNEKVVYNCIKQEITSSTADGRFEKQLIELKPGTRYYYRAYMQIGGNANYSKVESFQTIDPSEDITMATTDPSDIFAVCATLNGVVRVGNLQDINENQTYGFIYSTDQRMSSAETLSYKWWEDYDAYHFETQDEIARPDTICASGNLNGRINKQMRNIRPGSQVYYRAFFCWNGKYFYAPDVKSFKTLDESKITVGTRRVDQCSATHAILAGNVPLNTIGLEEVSAGFMISEKYSNASEFVLANAKPYQGHFTADIMYLEDTTDNNEFTNEISYLKRASTYYYCAYVKLKISGQKDPYVLIGNVEHFTTLDGLEDGITVKSSGTYPWTSVDGGLTWRSGNSWRNNSTSTLTIEVDSSNHMDGGFTFTCDVDADGFGNGVKISVIKPTGAETSLHNGELIVYGNTTETLEFESKGVYKVIVTYQKDSYGSGGSDTAVISGMRFCQLKD